MIGCCIDDDKNLSSTEDERPAAVANNIVLSLIDEQRRRRQTVSIYSRRRLSGTFAKHYGVYVCLSVCGQTNRRLLGFGSL